MQQQAKLVRVALDRKLATLGLEVSDECQESGVAMVEVAVKCLCI